MDFRKKKAHHILSHYVFIIDVGHFFLRISPRNLDKGPFLGNDHYGKRTVCKDAFS